LDTSLTMRGKPLSAALDSATTLIRHKPAKSEVAVIGYSAKPYLIHGWTTDAGAFEAPFAGVSTSHGTSVWDSVLLGSRLIDERGGAAKALVVLTDGKADISSAATADEAISRAAEVGVRVFVVSLGEGPEHENLARLAQRTGGELITVTTLAQLEQVYRDVSATLAKQYVLTYTSQTRDRGASVSVVVEADGLRAMQTYVVPATPASHGAANLQAPSLGPWLLIAAIAAVFVALGTLLVMRPVRVRPAVRLRPYWSSLGAGVPDWNDVPRRPERPSGRPRPGQVWARFAADVRRGQVGRSARSVMTMASAASFTAAVVIALASGRPETVLVVAPLGPLVAWIYVTHRASSWYAHFDGTLADSLLVLASSLRAGHSLLQALSHVAEEADDKTAVEWDEVVRQTRLGVSVEDALDDMVVRIGNKDLQWIALVARIQRQVGGNMAEMFDIVADTVRQRHRLRAQIQTLTVQGRMSRWILTLAPFALAAMFFVLSPDYLHALTADPAGIVMIAVAVVLSLIGSVWLKQIVEIEV
ncbi:MAG TPA: type II secretion system F family protein, partial [Gaiellales bacterium]|nr:type II secretion system F family protein [Gaiellales bacterium]